MAMECMSRTITYMLSKAIIDCLFAKCEGNPAAQLYES